jgi:hypothetical protein
MCEQCAAATIDIAEFAPGWKLVRATQDGGRMKAGQYGLVASDDPSYLLSVVPRPAPNGGVIRDVDNDPALGKAWDEWFDLAGRIDADLACDPPTGYAFVSACLEAGWDRPGSEFPLFWQWLTDRLGRILAGESVEGVKVIEPEPAKAKKAKGSKAAKGKGSKAARKTASPDPEKDHRGVY